MTRGKYLFFIFYGSSVRIMYGHLACRTGTLLDDLEEREGEISQLRVKGWLPGLTHAPVGSFHWLACCLLLPFSQPIILNPARTDMVRV